MVRQFVWLIGVSFLFRFFAFISYAGMAQTQNNEKESRRWRWNTSFRVVFAGCLYPLTSLCAKSKAHREDRLFQILGNAKNCEWTIG